MRTAILLAVLVGLSTAQAQVQTDYNNLYDQVLFEKTQWPSQLASQKGKVDQAQTVVDSAAGELQVAQVELQRLQADLETQEQHLAFLKRVEPLSLQEKEKIKQRVVSSGEFSSTGQVTLASLAQKASDLRNQQAQKQNEIDSNQQKITDLMNTAEYQGYVSRRDQLRRDKSLKESELDSVRRQIRNLKSDLSSLQFDLDASERREENARIRMVRIRQEIPNLRRDIRELERQIRDLRQDTQQKVQERSLVEGRRDQTKSKIQQKESELNQEGADIQAIEAELRDLRQQLNQQNQRIDRLTNQIQRNRRDIQSKERDQQRKEREIVDLENELERQERIVADEEIRQIRLEGDIRDKEREISRLEFDESGLESDVSLIDNRLAQVQSQINQYHTTHIRPIELTISQLESEKQRLIERRGALEKASTDLTTQDQNIATAKGKIPGQEQVVQLKTAEVAKSQSAIQGIEGQVATAKQGLQAEIKSYNSLIASIQQKRDKLKELETKYIEEIESKKNGGN